MVLADEVAPGCLLAGSEWLVLLKKLFFWLFWDSIAVGKRLTTIVWNLGKPEIELEGKALKSFERAEIAVMD